MSDSKCFCGVMFVILFCVLGLSLPMAATAVYKDWTALEVKRYEMRNRACKCCACETNLRSKGCGCER